MSETLDKIQKVFKVGKILVTIIFVCSIIGAVGSLIGLVWTAIAGKASVSIGSVTLLGLIEKEADMTFTQMIMKLVYAVVTCGAEILVAYKTLQYINNELDAGTPFTLEGAAELKKLGIFSIIVLIVGQSVAGLAIGIVEACTKQTVVTQNLGASPSITFGIMLLVMSLIFKYGAEKDSNHGQSGEIQ